MSTTTGVELRRDVSDRPRRRRRQSLSEFAWVWIALIVLILVSALIAPSTLSGSSLRLMAPYAAVLGVAAIGQALVIRQRGIDLSVPGVIGLAGIIVCKLSGTGGVPVPLAIVITCVVVGLVGGITGLIVTRIGITPLVTTLAINALLVGANQSYSGDVPIGAPRGLSDFALRRTIGIPNTAVVAIGIVLVVAIAVRKTVAGRRWVAAGNNPAASFVAGVRVARYQIGTYVVAAILYGIAGILLTGYVQTAVPAAGDSYLLPVIAAVVVGGTPFSGGRGSVLATAVAALFLTQLLQLVLSLGAPTSTQLLIQSGAIALATVLRHVPWARLGPPEIFRRASINRQ